VIDAVKNSNFDVLIFNHSDGNIPYIMSDLFETGVQVVQGHKL